LADEQIMARKGEVKCIVTSAQTLTPEELVQMKNSMGKLVEGRSGVPEDAKITIETRVDPRLIGGFTVGIGEEFIDLSLIDRIRQVELEMAKPIVWTNGVPS